MSILEALISITIAASIVAGAVEAWQSAIGRSAMARTDTELTLVARTLLLQATSTIAMESSAQEGVTPSGVRWKVKTTIPPERGGLPRIAEIEVALELVREGPAVRSRLTTLRLLPE